MVIIAAVATEPLLHVDHGPLGHRLGSRLGGGRLVRRVGGRRDVARVAVGGRGGRRTGRRRGRGHQRVVVGVLTDGHRGRRTSMVGGGGARE